VDSVIANTHTTVTPAASSTLLLVIMASPKTTKLWKLKTAPVKDFDEGNFEIDVEAVPDIAEGEVLLRSLYISNGETSAPPTDTYTKS
jgi:hypothetical protein